ncbi:MAG: hypothetical protein R3F59_32735 [Myxococcota bacterium]
MSVSDDLATKLFRHPRFAWREGMKDQRGIRVVDVDLWDPDGPPDLGDAATVGILLGWLAEIDLLSDVVRQDGAWIVAVELPDGLQGWMGETMGEAAAAALLAAWDGLPDS